jgi:hypothetical protein
MSCLLFLPRQTLYLAARFQKRRWRNKLQITQDLDSGDDDWRGTPTQAWQ